MKKKMSKQQVSKNVKRNMANPKKKPAPKSNNWIVLAGLAGVIVVLAVVGLILFLGGEGEESRGSVVARVNAIEIFEQEVRNEIHRGSHEFGHIGREDAVRNAAVPALIEDYARGLGVYLTDETAQWIQDEIENFIANFGQDEFDMFLAMSGYRNRAHLENSFAFDQVLDALADAVRENHVEFARFEAFDPSINEDVIRETAYAIMERAQAGENFDDLVETYGQDPGMVGNLEGYTFPPGQMVVEFEQATLALEIGEISGLVRSQFGYHIIKRVEPNLDLIWEGADPDIFMGAKHILISTPDLGAVINAYFENMLNTANIEFLPALDRIEL